MQELVDIRSSKTNAIKARKEVYIVVQSFNQK